MQYDNAILQVTTEDIWSNRFLTKEIRPLAQDSHSKKFLSVLRLSKPLRVQKNRTAVGIGFQPARDQGVHEANGGLNFAYNRQP